MTSNTPKDRLMMTATRLFHSQGYHATGINQILQESKVAKASLYLHYGSKEDLAIEYLQKASEEWMQRTLSHLNGPKTPAKKLASLFDTMEVNMHENGFKGCKFINLASEIADSSPQLSALIAMHKRKVLDLFIAILKDEKPSHTVEARQEMLAQSIFLLFEGALIESKIHKAIWPIRIAKQTALLLLDKGS